jgi:hypothetical protein
MASRQENADPKAECEAPFSNFFETEQKKLARRRRIEEPLAGSCA